MNDSITCESFGRFFKAKREEADLTLRETARALDVSPAFLSDVENNRTAPLTKERLDSAAVILHLSREDRDLMFDLAGKQKNTIAPDLPEYIMGRDYVAAALRTAKELDVGEQEWAKFVEELRRNHGNA